MTVVCGDSHTTHARRVRSARIRHRHERGRARPRDPDVAADPTEVDGDHRRRRASRGSTAKDVILGVIGRIGTGGGIGYVMEYRGSVFRAAFDGRPDDGLQHVDRGRRARRAHRTGRHHVRLPRGAPARTQRQGVGASDRRLAHARHRRRCEVRCRGHRRRGDPRPPRHLGNEPGAGDRHRRFGARSIDLRRARTIARRAERALAYMGLEAGTPLREQSRSTRCSSVRARTVASRTCAPQRQWSTAST